MHLLHITTYEAEEKEITNWTVWQWDQCTVLKQRRVLIQYCKSIKGSYRFKWRGFYPVNQFNQVCPVVLPLTRNCEAYVLNIISFRWTLNGFDFEQNFSQIHHASHSLLLCIAGETHTRLLQVTCAKKSQIRAAYSFHCVININRMKLFEYKCGMCPHNLWRVSKLSTSHKNELNKAASVSFSWNILVVRYVLQNCCGGFSILLEVCIYRIIELYWYSIRYPTHETWYVPYCNHTVLVFFPKVLHTCQYHFHCIQKTSQRYA